MVVDLARFNIDGLYALRLLLTEDAFRTDDPWFLDETNRVGAEIEARRG